MEFEVSKLNVGMWSLTALTSIDGCKFLAQAQKPSEFYKMFKIGGCKLGFSQNRCKRKLKTY